MVEDSFLRYLVFFTTACSLIWVQEIQAQNSCEYDLVHIPDVSIHLYNNSLVRGFLKQTLLCRLPENRLKAENCVNYLDNWKDWFKEAFSQKFVCDVLKVFPGVIRCDTSSQYRTENSSHKSSLHLSFSWLNSVTNEVMRT